MRTTEDPAVVRNARFKLALMFLLPGLVVLLATTIYYTGVGLPRGTINKGVLVQPPRQIDDIALHDQAGKPWRYDGEKRGWGILLTGGVDCRPSCRERIALTQRLRTALGKDANRVHRYYLAAADTRDAGLRTWIGAEQKDLVLLYAEATAIRGLLGRSADPDPLASGVLYLVDPRGFVMMHYLPTHVGGATLDDLRFLLRNSPP